MEERDRLGERDIVGRDYVILIDYM
jgi:hypothetical protein